MTRSRALNRFKRFTAKRKRRSLRSDIPNLRENNHHLPKQSNHSDQLREQALKKEASIDLLEPEL